MRSTPDEEQQRENQDLFVVSWSPQHASFVLVHDNIVEGRGTHLSPGPEEQLEKMDAHLIRASSIQIFRDMDQNEQQIQKYPESTPLSVAG